MKTKLTSQLKKRQQSLYEAFRWLKINSVHDGAKKRKKRQNVVSIKMWLDLAERIRQWKKEDRTACCGDHVCGCQGNDRNDPTQNCLKTRMN